MAWIEFAAVLILAGIIWYAGTIPEEDSFEEDEEWSG